MDAPLVRAARGGSQAAFSRLVAIHEKPLRGFLRKSGWIDADDIAQDAFVAAWTSLGRLRADDGFRAWLYGIAWRKGPGPSPRRQPFGPPGRGLARTGGPGGARQVAGEDRMALQAALETLPEDQRACVTLCLGQGWSHAEAAEALNMPLGTVKSHVTRGRERLLAVLGEPS
jgi:DNA-directed RNA polymerase specialized sigma24 family protein